MKYELRPYQDQAAEDGLKILNEFGILYLAMEVRTGKTLTSLEVAKRYGAKSVIFLTKKKAIPSIKEDYKKFEFSDSFSITVINDESMHKIDPDIVSNCDMVIHDEHHRFSSTQKPGKSAKVYREMFFDKPQIWLTGTPSPESYSQFYHQFWVSANSPWSRYKNFYRWADDYVDKKQKRIGTHMINDYTRGIKDKILPDIEKYMVKLTQKDAGFTTNVDEEILEVTMKPQTYAMCKKLLKDLVLEGKEEVILADTPAKLRQKLHQMYSGTIKFESGNRMILDTTKAEFIHNHFAGKKIAIFYKFVAELDCLRQVIGDKLTTDVDEFKTDPDKWYAVQIISGREGTSYSEADYLVFYNICDSATSYWQARDRLTTKDRSRNQVYWIFSKDGIEHKIYKSVLNKKSYVNSIFKRDFNIKKEKK